MCARTKQPPRGKFPIGPLKTITKRTDDIVTKYPDRLKFLTDMGFDDRQAQAALEKTDYNVEEAAKLLKSEHTKLNKPKSEDDINDEVEDEDEPKGQEQMETFGEQADADQVPAASLSAGNADQVPIPKPNSETSPKGTDPEEQQFVLESPINPPSFDKFRRRCNRYSRTR